MYNTRQDRTSNETLPYARGRLLHTQPNTKMEDHPIHHMAVRDYCYITLASFHFWFLLLYGVLLVYTHANLGKRGMSVAVNNVAMVICPRVVVIRSYIRRKTEYSE